MFKFPGDGNMNYIKRLVGLPGEELQIYQGDVFTQPLAARTTEFRIERKPADKVAAMLQPVHDTDYESATLYNAGWPLRWAATTPDGWKVDAERRASKTVESAVHGRFARRGARGVAALSASSSPSTTDDWEIAASVAEAGSLARARRREGVHEEQAAALGRRIVRN